jgi:hypothetical protein
VEEVKMILGWTLETRRLLLLLPTDKYEEWSSDIPKMIAKKSSRGGKLRNTVDRLNHVGYIIPVARHFLGGNPSFEECSYPTTEVIRRIKRAVLKDLRLWLDLLGQSHRKISLTMLTIREATTLYRADACKHGIGVFNVFLVRA